MRWLYEGGNKQGDAEGPREEEEKWMRVNLENKFRWAESKWYEEIQRGGRGDKSRSGEEAGCKSVPRELPERMAREGLQFGA